jgi:hypothetical protein
MLIVDSCGCLHGFVHQNCSPHKSIQLITLYRITISELQRTFTVGKTSTTVKRDVECKENYHPFRAKARRLNIDPSQLHDKVDKLE